MFALASSSLRLWTQCWDHARFTNAWALSYALATYLLTNTATNGPDSTVKIASNLSDSSGIEHTHVKCNRKSSVSKSTLKLVRKNSWKCLPSCCMTEAVWHFELKINGRTSIFLKRVCEQPPKILSKSSGLNPSCIKVFGTHTFYEGREVELTPLPRWFQKR